MTRSTARTLALILALAALPLAPARAGGLSAVINGKSYHFDSTYDWNEQNTGFGLEYAFKSESRWRMVAMANGFRDSTDGMSYMAGGGLHRRLVEVERFAGLYVDAGVNAFLMTREDYNHNRPFPGILPSLSIGNRYAGFNLTYLPRKAVTELLEADIVDPTISGILFVQFKVSLNAH